MKVQSLFITRTTATASAGSRFSEATPGWLVSAAPWISVLAELVQRHPSYSLIAGPEQACIENAPTIYAAPEIVVVTNKFEHDLATCLVVDVPLPDQTV